jgi:NADH:ubiquinone oxidoreductase subunit
MKKAVKVVSKPKTIPARDLFAPAGLSETTKIPPGTHTYILLIWEEIPERTRLVLIPGSEWSEELRDVLRSVNAKYMNGTEMSAEESRNISILSNALCTKAEYMDSEVDPRWNGKFVPYVWGGYEEEEETDPKPIEGKIITAVYRTGWFL